MKVIEIKGNRIVAAQCGSCGEETAYVDGKKPNFVVRCDNCGAVTNYNQQQGHARSAANLRSAQSKVLS